MNRITELSKSYDALAATYASGRHLFDTSPLLHQCAALVPGNARVLDVGCGAGEPVSAYFAKRGDQVTGIDISSEMLELARRQVPAANFTQMDLRHLEFAEAQFDLLTAVYCVFHLDREEHQSIFDGFARVLKPGGIVLLTLACKGYTGEDEFDGNIEFLGHSLPYSHDRPEVALQKLSQAGLHSLMAETRETGGETFFWVIAKKA